MTEIIDTFAKWAFYGALFFWGVTLFGAVVDGLRWLVGV